MLLRLQSPQVSCATLGSDSFVVGVNAVLHCKLDSAVFNIDSNNIYAATEIRRFVYILRSSL